LSHVAPAGEFPIPQPNRMVGDAVFPDLEDFVAVHLKADA
jgi:hypothetical protein